MWTIVRRKVFTSSAAEMEQFKAVRDVRKVKKKIRGKGAYRAVTLSNVLDISNHFTISLVLQTGKWDWKMGKYITSWSWKTKIYLKHLNKSSEEDECEN